MLEPPQNGSPYDLLPEGQTNPDAWACVIAWDAMRTFGTQALSEGLDDLQNLQGVAM